MKIIFLISFFILLDLISGDELIAGHVVSWDESNWLWSIL